MVSRYNRGAFPVAALLIPLMFAAWSANAKPNPPPKVCIGANCVTQTSTSAAIKWHPGHYVWLDMHASQASHLAAIDALSAETSVQGVQVLMDWALLEGATPGDYSQGFARVDAYLAKLASLKVPKRLILGVNERNFGTAPASGTPCSSAASSLLPGYLAAQSNGCAIAAPGAAGSLAVMAKFWEPAVMDRLIALSKAYAQRYDQNPLFEVFAGNSETAVAAPAGSGFTYTAYITQLKRWFDESKPAWTHTQLRLYANWVDSDAHMLDLITYVRGGTIVGGPDPELPLPNITRSIQANKVFRNADGSGTDFRGTVPWVGEVQALGIGYRFTQTPAEIYDYQSNTMHASYLIWMRNTWTGGAAQKWDTGILPFIQSIKGKVYSTDCPPTFPQGCTTN